jgi:hypothetical protein
MARYVSRSLLGRMSRDGEADSFRASRRRRPWRSFVAKSAVGDPLQGVAAAFSSWAFPLGIVISPNRTPRKARAPFSARVRP